MHFFVRVKKDATEPLVYGLLLATLLGLRLYEARRKRATKRAGPAAHA